MLNHKLDQALTARAGDAILERIIQAADGKLSSSQIRVLAESYALVVGTLNSKSEVVVEK